MAHVMEIAVRKVKAGQLNAFKVARSAFIKKLKGLDGVVADAEFESFYALPEPDDTPVFIGMTIWASPEAAGAASGVLMGSEEMNAFMATLDFKAYVMVQPADSNTLDLSAYAGQPGQVLELAVRAVNDGMEEKFVETRDKFVELLNAQEGALESFEFNVVSESEQNLTVGMTVYESQEAFQAIAGSIMQEEITGQYFSTFVPVAAQYSFRTTND